MLKTNDIIKDLKNETQIEMIRQLNIPDFYKCIAQFSGLAMNAIVDGVMKEYILTWAASKERIFKLFGRTLKLDRPFSYNREVEGDSRFDSMLEDWKMIEREFPGFKYWIDVFKLCRENIMKKGCFSWREKDEIEKLIQESDWDNMKITAFFKSKLNAPDKMVANIGTLYGGQEVNYNYCMSIDPVDIMLASETPYGWQSCYRLELDNPSSHADGCMAAVLDDTSIITYLWNDNGKFKLHSKYEFKDIRYKKIRQFVSISKNFTTLHFNTAYPGKGNYGKEFKKLLREPLEELISIYLQTDNLWKHYNWREGCNINRYGELVDREYPYGYDEFNENNLYYLSGTEVEPIEPYNRGILCADGCGDTLLGSSYSPDFEYDDCDDNGYNGQGFIAENFQWSEIEYEICPYSDDTCRDANNPCWDYCEGCSWWENAHPMCSEDNLVQCENFEDNDLDVEYGIAKCNPERCKDCSHCPQPEPEEPEEAPAAETNTDIGNGIPMHEAVHNMIYAGYSYHPYARLSDDVNIDYNRTVLGQDILTISAGDLVEDFRIMKFIMIELNEFFESPNAFTEANKNSLKQTIQDNPNLSELFKTKVLAYIRTYF